MARQGFSKSVRLLGPAQFDPVFKKTAFKLSTSCLLILVGISDGRARLGVVVAKKHVKTAVQRNRVKRIIRESFRLRQAEFGTIDLVVLARQGLDQLDNRAIMTQLNFLRHNAKSKSFNSCPSAAVSYCWLSLSDQPPAWTELSVLSKLFCLHQRSYPDTWCNSWKLAWT